MSVGRNITIWNGEVTMVLLPVLQMLKPQTQIVGLSRVLLNPGQKESGMGARGKFCTLICMILCKKCAFSYSYVTSADFTIMFVCVCLYMYIYVCMCHC